jgi:hypothetical protein
MVQRVCHDMYAVEMTYNPLPKSLHFQRSVSMKLVCLGCLNETSTLDFQIQTTAECVGRYFLQIFPLSLGWMVSAAVISFKTLSDVEYYFRVRTSRGNRCPWSGNTILPQHSADVVVLEL